MSTNLVPQLAIVFLTTVPSLASCLSLSPLQLCPTWRQRCLLPEFLEHSCCQAQQNLIGETEWDYRKEKKKLKPNNGPQNVKPSTELPTVCLSP